MNIQVLSKLFQNSTNEERNYNFDIVQQLKRLFGKSQTLILLISFETILQCMIDDASGKYE